MARSEAGSTSTKAHPWVIYAMGLVGLVAWVVFSFLPSKTSTQAEAIHWLTPEAAASLGKQDKPILYDFTADWCPPCQQMRRDVFMDPTLADEIQKDYIPVKVLDRAREDGSNSAAVDQLQRKYTIQAFPTLVVAYPNGAGPKVAEGYDNKDKTMAFLRDSAQSAPVKK